MQVTERARSATAEARRTQIEKTTIEVIADEGLRQATFARIAARAELSSTRLISYHYSSKEELIGAVAQRVVSAIGTAVGARVRAETSAASQLRVYIEAVVRFTSEQRTAMQALLAIALGGGLPPALSADLAEPSHVEAILRRGQAAGEFRDFDPWTMALTVQRALEALPFVLAFRPDLDCDAFAHELVTLFALATQPAADGSGR